MSSDSPNANASTRCIVLIGLSGAGRSVAAGALEDLGWYVIDNLPSSLIPEVGSLVQSGGRFQRIALVLGEYGADVVAGVDGLRCCVDDVRFVFLEASTEVLVRRYESTKRRHPLADGDGLAKAISRQRTELAAARAAADLVLDTSELNPHELRSRLIRMIDTDGDAAMTLTVTSFGFKHGLPRDVDLVLDCRFLPNPYWVPELRSLSGLDDAIAEYVIGDGQAQEFIANLDRMLKHLLPAYEAEGKSYLTIAFGCTGGRHRSVAMAEHIAGLLGERSYAATVEHRDIER